MYNLNWLDPTRPLQINNPNFHHLLYHGFGNARSLAKIFHTVRCLYYIIQQRLVTISTNFI